MNIKNFINKISFWTKKNSPEILIVAGIISGAASIILACRSTLKVDDTIKSNNDVIKKIHDDLKDDNKIANGIVNPNEAKKSLVKEYAKVSGKILKLYLPSILTFGASVTSVLYSHKIMKGRNIALAAAYTTIDAAYNSYRNRVKKAIGEEAEEKIYKNIFEENKDTIVEKKDGTEKEITKNVNIAHMDEYSDFSYLFDESNPNWSKSPRLNFDWLQMQETYLDQRLKTYGYLFLSDVYDALGIEAGIIGERKLQASKVLGWIYDPDDESRDSYVSFGLGDRLGNLSAGSIKMLREGETNIWLSFNVDGDILTGDIDSSTGKRKKTFMKYAKI